MNYGSDYRLYWLPNGWMVGDKRGAPTGYIYNSASNMCPYQIASGWMVYSSTHHGWLPDYTLVLRCADGLI